MNNKTEQSVPRHIIYIGGYGRSGSTILDAMLGNQDDISSGGEIGNLLRDYSATGFEDYPESVAKIWKAAADAGLKEVDATFSKAIAIDKKIRLVNKGPGILIPGYTRTNQRFWKAVYGVVASVTGTTSVVDSSKTTLGSLLRPWLIRKQGFGLKFILLVRDPRAVLWSRQRGVNYLIDSGADNIHNRFGKFRAITGWFIYTSVGMLYYFFLPNKAIVIYENLMSKPEETLADLEQKLDVDLSDVQTKLRNGEEFDFGNGFSGNRVRKKGSFHLKIDDKWKTGYSSLPLVARFFSSINYKYYQLISKIARK